MSRNMFKSVAMAASREENAAISLVKMAKPKNQTTPNKRPNLTQGTLPTTKGKGPIINALVPLIRQVTQDTDLQYFIISLYDETSNDKYTVDLFSGMTHKKAREIIEAHAKMFSKTDGGVYRGSAPELNFNLNEDNMVNLAYLMYLDMIHDGTINGESFKKPKNNNGANNVIPELTFNDFCEENIVLPVKVPVVINGKKTKKFKIIQKKQKSPVFILFGKAIVPKETPFIKRIRKFGGEGTGAELAIKNNLPSIHLKSDGTSYLPIYKEINRDQIKSNILKEGHNLFMGIDQEDEKATVTLNIAQTKYNYKKLNGTNGTAKKFYPLVSVANLMDPGKNMLIESAKENTKYLMSPEALSRLTWNYKQPKFEFKMNHGSTVISTYYTDEVKIVNTGNNKKKTKRGYEYTINNANNNDAERVLSSSMSKAQAQVGTSNDRVAKFMGDFMQALTMCAYIKNNTLNTGNRKYNYCLATGDAMLCNSFIFMCSISNTTPNLWMPISKQQISLVYGDMLNNFNPNSNVKSAPTEVVNANRVLQTPSRSNGTRSNGSGYAKPISLNGISAGSLAGSTVASNNNGNNEIQSPNRGRIILNKQLRAKGLNNNTVNTLLKNYKNGMNVSRVIAKANIIVLNKKKAENKKNLNQRLRKKGLNSTNINALLKNYNNGMNVNRVITKANAIVLNKKRAENKKNLNKRLRAKGLNNANRIALLNNYNKGTMNVNKVITKANQIINNKRSNPAEMNLGAAIMSGEGMKRQRNNTENNRNAVIAKLQAQLARAQAAQNAAEKAKNAAARNARNARNASNAQAARNAAEKNAAANKAANEANAKVKRQERALRQLQTNASLAGVSPNQGLRKSKRQK